MSVDYASHLKNVIDRDRAWAQPLWAQFMLRSLMTYLFGEAAHAAMACHEYGIELQTKLGHDFALVRDDRSVEYSAWPDLTVHVTLLKHGCCPIPDRTRVLLLPAHTEDAMRLSTEEIKQALEDLSSTR